MPISMIVGGTMVVLGTISMFWGMFRIGANKYVPKDWSHRVPGVVTELRDGTPRALGPGTRCSRSPSRTATRPWWSPGSGA